jgi:hypothetical protein
VWFWVPGVRFSEGEAADGELSRWGALVVAVVVCVFLAVVFGAW